MSQMQRLSFDDFVSQIVEIRSGWSDDGSKRWVFDVFFMQMLST